MRKYRKKPVVIEAVQWRYAPGAVDALLEWGCPAEPAGEWGTDHTLLIHTLEGTMQCSEGNYIIRGVRGEFYPCKEQIFLATYEPVED